jgi:DNA repair protein RecO (recombination protein O)
LEDWCIVSNDETFFRTDALCLRITPFSRTSHIVSWLTPNHGLLRTIVKGACRPKSWFLGQYDLFQTCEVIAYARAANGLHVLKDCVPLAPRPLFRTDWRAAAIASYLCDFAARNLLGSSPQPECYALLFRALDALPFAAEKLALTFWFEIRFAHALGMSPSLIRCSSCNHPLPPSSASRTFSVSQGGLLCSACPVREPGKALQLAPDLVAILRRWQRAEWPNAALNTRCSAKQLLAILGLLDVFLNFHLETKPSGRHAAIELSTLKDPTCLAVPG